jgi:hypothetical protein
VLFVDEGGQMQIKRAGYDTHARESLNILSDLDDCM